MNQLRKIWAEHPNLASWAALALGMVIIVVLSARSVASRPASGPLSSARRSFWPDCAYGSSVGKMTANEQA